MSRGTSRTDEEKTKIRELTSLGFSNRKIALRIGRTEKAVRTYVNDPDGIHREPRPGATPKLDARNVRHVFQLACKDHLKSAKIINVLDLKCETCTVRRALQRNENTHYIKRKSIPLMTSQHKKNRLACANEKLRRKFNWDVVVISDEKKFNLDGPDGCQYYWHDRRLPEEVYSKRVVGGGSVMVWAGISAVGMTEIVFLEGRQKATNYISTLSSALQPFLDAIRQLYHDPQQGR